MTSGFLNTAAAALLAFALWIPVPSLAQGGLQDGVLRAKNFKSIARGAAISVEPEDRTDLNMRLKPIIEAELRARGFKISETAPIRFIYNADTPETRQLRTRLRRSAERGSSLGRDPRRRSGPMRHPLFRRGLNFTGQPIKRGETRHLISVIVLNDTGVQYWVGTASVDGRRGDSFAITSTLSRQLAHELGRTVEKMKFRIN